MVRKLFKHELQYYVRTLLPMYLVLGGVALMGRFLEFFESEDSVYSIIRSSSIIMLGITCAAVLGLTFLFCVVRYYRNLFSGEGYLTLTLPVTPKAHILVKLTAGLLVNLVSLLAVVLGICLFTVGPWLVELWKAAVYIYKIFAREFQGHLGWYILECIPLALVFVVNQLLLYYMCISVGQMAKKNRIAAAVGVYFGLYVISQIIGTVCVLSVSVFHGLDWFFEYMGSLTHAQVLGWYHGFIWMIFGVYALLSVAYYFVSKFVVTKRLNLE